MYTDGSFLAKDQESKYGFIKLNGEVTLPFVYDKISNNYNNNYTSLKNGKCGLVRVNSGDPQEILTCDFDEIKNEKNVIITKKNSKYGLLDKNGKVIIEPTYDNIEIVNKSGYSSNPFFIAKDTSGYDLIDLRGKIMNETKYYEIKKIPNNTRSYSSSYEYLKAKLKEGKYNVIDKAGYSITKAEFDNIIYEDNNMLLVQSNGMMGIYHLTYKKLIVKYMYEQIIKIDNIYMGINGTNFNYFEINGSKMKKI